MSSTPTVREDFNSLIGQNHIIIGYAVDFNKITDAVTFWSFNGEHGSINGSILVPRLGSETSLFPPVNDKCDSRTRFSNRLGSRSVEKRTPISRRLCTWRKRYSLRG
ncbi:hypothetical protein AVEN_172477-1 [Araneus ventricosus]|uniref:Uncharacterized protein n=1 Tax=Araneus ventricosus TaxID=182803 RepID=A0A4Y2RXU8_ARAVE|nr:hypothetical protein AVEN_172477-1 [Araneus ventricosus]